MKWIHDFTVRVKGLAFYGNCMGCVAKMPNITQVPIHGEMSSYQTQPNYCRYHMVMPTVSRETLPMQDLASCDSFRTPVIFWVPDNLVFVGDPLQIALWRLRELHPSGSLASPKSIYRKGTRHQRPGYFKMVVISRADQPSEGR